MPGQRQGREGQTRGVQAPGVPAPGRIARRLAELGITLPAAPRPVASYVPSVRTAGLVFVTAFETRRAMQAFLGQISWESEVWIAEAPEHLIHFNGERFLGPYSDAMPVNKQTSA